MVPFQQQTAGRRRAVAGAFIAASLMASACISSGDSSAVATGDESPASALGLPSVEQRDFGSPPPTPQGDLEPEIVAALDRLFLELLATPDNTEQTELVKLLATSNDPRIGWLFSDLLRFTQQSALGQELATASSQLLEIDVSPTNAWGEVTEHLIAWDVPAPPGYLGYKRALYELVVPEWALLFEEGSEVDWRHVSWGGVGIDSRPFGQTDQPCNCIPAADNPPVTNASGGDWYSDDGIVFGVEIDGEARAYPRNIMEIREMVNDTLGGRDIGMPYCTLCGSAQVYFTDELPDGIERPVLRTSGLLIRSNKVMYDVNSNSVFDTFLGNAVTGPLATRRLVLAQHSVVTTTWGEWKADHPDTTILAEELALGRDSDLRNTRDADGPIFPIGDVDARLPVQEDVIGVIGASGQPLAFHLTSAKQQLEAGNQVVADDIRLVLDGGGVKALDLNGNDVGSHQAFWFAWSQFHPDTALWPGT